MKHLCSTLFAVTLSVGAFAQTITNVIITPSSINECTPINITIQGTFPSGQYEPLFFNVDTIGGDIELNFYAVTCANCTTSTFSQALPAIGPYVAGTYPFTATLFINGVSVDDWTTTITVNPPPPNNPGLDSSVTLCTSDPNVQLLTLLGGNPDPGGQWVAPNGQNHGPTFNPGTDLQGFWSYLFNLPAPCVSTSSLLIINYAPYNDPGIGGNAVVCSIGAPVDLFTYLTGTPASGGTWTGPGAVNLPGGIYDPLVQSAGAYIYSVPGIGICGPSTSTLNVTEAPPNNSGVGSSGEVCSDDTSTPLNSFLTGSPQTTGAWFSPSNVAIGGYASTFNAAVDPPGTYTYIVGGSYCPLDSAFVTITLIAPCVSIEEVDPNIARYELMPNPSDGHVTLELEVLKPGVDYRMEVLGVRGELLHTEAIPFDGAMSVRRSFDLTMLAKGAYVVRLVSSDGNSSSRRLLLR